ncbi:MAG: RDD family protein [Robiginitalea sp.]
MRRDNIKRIGAFLIDMLLIGIAYTVASNVLPWKELSHDLIWDGRSIGWSVDLFGLLNAAYFVGTGLLNKGDSPGKDILHLKTLRLEDGTELGYKQSLARTLLKLISICMLPVAAFLYVWKGREFTLQDFLIKTTVRPVKAVK